MKAKYASLALIAVALSSCAAINQAVTGQPVPTTEVSREGGVPFKVATQDVVQAEISQGKTYGLYDLGFVAGVAGKVKSQPAVVAQK